MNPFLTDDLKMRHIVIDVTSTTIIAILTHQYLRSKFYCPISLFSSFSEADFGESKILLHLMIRITVNF